VTIEYNKKPHYRTNSVFLKEAFELFCQGVSATKIADRLGERWPGLCRQTISKIVKEYDWEEQRARYLTLRIDGADEKRKLLSELQACREKLYKIINGPDPNHQHFAQYYKALELIMEIEGIGKNGGSDVALSGDMEMNAWIEAVTEDEVLGPVLKKRKAEIRRKFEEKLKDKGLESASGKASDGQHP